MKRGSGSPAARRGWVPLAIAAAWLAAPAHAETRPAYGFFVEGSLLGAPVGFDPVEAQSHAEITVVGLVFDTLYAIGLDGTAEPHLAIGAPVVDAARTTAHVALRRGVRFHDGSALTAADVVESLSRVQGSAAAWVLAPVATVTAAGDGLDLALRAPGVDVAALLALPQTAITPHGQAPAAPPIGSGPFAVQRLDPADKSLTLKAFDDHFAGRPYIDRLVLRWFDTPDAEVRRFETGVSQLSARGRTTFGRGTPKFPARDIDSPPAVLLFVGFGRQHPAVTADPAFRRALDLALDRDAVAAVKTGEQTQPTRLPLPVEAGAPPLPAAGRTGNEQAARAVLAEAAARSPALSDASLRATKLAILVDATRPDDREIALRVARGLDRLHIAFTIQAVAADALRGHVRAGTCDLWIGQIAAPLGAAAVWWGAAFAAGGDGWAQQQLAAGAIEPVAAEQAFARRLPIVPLMFRSLLMSHRVDVHGLGFDASARPELANLYWFKAHP